MKRLRFLLAAASLVAGFSNPLRLASAASLPPAADAASVLPAANAVLNILRTHPDVLATRRQIDAEEANRRRLEAGPYEWNLRLGGQQRRVAPTSSADERYKEWNTALERPLRLPGKSAADSDIGALGVQFAETASALAWQETARALLQDWFNWLKDSASADQWRQQVELLTRQAEALRRRQTLGDAAALEVTQSEAALAQAAAQAAQAELRQRTARASLERRYPGLPLITPAGIAEPQALAGTTATWVARILERHPERRLAQTETERALRVAERLRQDRLPDPSIGIQFSRERGGEENVIGAFISIPFPGGARQASAEAAGAQAAASGERQRSIDRKVGAEALTLVRSSEASLDIWQANRDAAERLTRSAAMQARAYQLGEGSLNELLLARRLANEAQLAARLSQLEALEFQHRLALDAHQLWAPDESGP